MQGIMLQIWMHSDKACSCCAQTGLVLEVTRDVDVVLSTGQVLERQPSHCLQPEIVFQPHLYVLHNDGWFGRINHVSNLPTNLQTALL